MADKASTAPVAPFKRTYHGSASIKDYELLRKLGEGTFGEVYQGHRKSDPTIYALKKILMHNEKEGFPITALREIKLLKTLDHVNVIKLEEMAIERNKEELKKRAVLYMVFPYMEHDLSGMLDNHDIEINEPIRKCYMLQLLSGLKYLHQSHILHRDMKAANLLINNRGILKIADFGLARHYEGPIPLAGKGGGEAVRDYTGLVVTRWYRPPELLLQLRRYTTAIDLWGAGCVFGEMFKRKPILTGQSDLHQTQIIFELVGYPTEKTMPGWSGLPGAEPFRQAEPSSTPSIERTFSILDPQALSLLKDLLKLDWRTRITAVDAMEHPYFKTHPLPARPEDIPRFADSHELDRRNHRPGAKALPPAPQGGTVGGSNAEWQHGPNAGGPGYNDRGSPRRQPRSNHYDNRQSRNPPGGYRDNRGNSNRPPPDRDHPRGPPPDRDHPRAPPSRVPAGNANHRSGWEAPRNGDVNAAPGSHTSLPPPPGEGARHPLPMNPHLKKDTYIPSYDAPPRRNDRERSPDRRENGQRYREDNRRPPPDYRERGGPPRDERYREHERGFSDRTRTRSPDNRMDWKGREGYRDR